MYRSGSWSSLQREAALRVPAPGPHEDLIGDRLAGILHVDDPLRLAAYGRLVISASVDGLSDAERRLMTGFHFAAIPSKIAPTTLAESVALLHAHPAIVKELRELIPLLDERSEHLTYPLELTQPDGSLLPVPLSVHARHTVDDVLTAFGILDFDKTAWKQTGAIRDERTNSDLFFVTLEKSERDYSPSTLYKDYAISPTLFHWDLPSRRLRSGRIRVSATSSTGSGTATSCCSCVQGGGRTSGRCRTHSWAWRTTSHTRKSGRFSLCGDCGGPCPQIPSGNRRSPAVSKRRRADAIRRLRGHRHQPQFSSGLNSSRRPELQVNHLVFDFPERQVVSCDRPSDSAGDQIS